MTRFPSHTDSAPGRAGERNRDILEVVALVALNVLTGAIKVASLEPDHLAATA